MNQRARSLRPVAGRGSSLARGRAAWPRSCGRRRARGRGPGQRGSSILSVSTTSLPAGQTSTVTVTGCDYLVPPHAPGIDVFGGVYVFFGWVAGGAWGPSSAQLEQQQRRLRLHVLVPR